MPIKMTKELPTEEGWYYWAENPDKVPDILEVEYQSSSVGFNYEFFAHDPKRLCALVGDNDRSVEYLGGYWAKVDKDQFEFGD